MALDNISSLVGEVLPHIQAAVDKSSQLATWMAPFFLVGVTLYVIFHGFEVMRGGGGSSPLLDLVSKIARPVIVFHLALAGGMYSSTVVGFFMELRTDLVSLFGTKGDSYVALDGAFTSVVKSISLGATVAMQNITLAPFSLNGLVMMGALAVIGLCFVIYLIFVTINLVVIDVSLYVLFGFGPIFIACFAFQATARFFDTWLSSVLKYTFTAVLMSMVIGVSNKLVIGYVGAMGGNPDFDSLMLNTLGAFLALGIITVLVLKTATLAADMVGGIGVNLSGSTAVGKAISTGASGAANAAGYVGGAAAGGAARYGSMAAGQVMGGSLGASVLKQTEAMRAAVGSVGSRVASSATGFGNAVAGRSVSASGDVSRGHGFGNAFSIGRQLSGAAGRGTVTGAR